jgi:hypothetical protein
MFEEFQRSFARDPGGAPATDEANLNSGVPGFSELIAAFGGSSFARGLYRVIRAADLGQWKARVSLGFPEFEERITCFGYDWLGRTFAIDSQRKEQGQPGVVMFEPGTGEALEIPSNIQTFHDGELIGHADAALATDFHQRWLANGGAAPTYAQCVGYRKPLFLGGADELENLELSDLDVYWHLMGQMIANTKGLPLGTPVQFSIG